MNGRGKGIFLTTADNISRHRSDTLRWLPCTDCISLAVSILKWHGQGAHIWRYAWILVSAISLPTSLRNSSTSSGVIPRIRVKRATPESPDDIFSQVHSPVFVRCCCHSGSKCLPNSLSLESMGHLFMGHMNRLSSISTNPTSSSWTWYEDALSQDLPILRPPSSMRSLNLPRAVPLRVSSSLRIGKQQSLISK